MSEPLTTFTDNGAQIAVTVDESAEPGDWLPVLARILVAVDNKQVCGDSIPLARRSDGPGRCNQLRRERGL